jgi:predicted metal-dependent phosphoesterase TrpH
MPTILMVHLLNADLHCHSNFSDGSLTPEALAERAHANEVALWSLTDHDEIAGQARARTAAEALGMRYVSGVEISVTFAGETVHMLGFGFDVDNPALQAGLAGIRHGRRARAQAMADSLAQAGIPNALEGSLAFVGNPELVSRTHFARFLVERGTCATVHEVFRRFLTPGKPGYVPHRWAGLGEAVRWVREAGGVAVIAHPARYHFSPTEEYALLTEFIAHGGQGVEVVCGSHFPADAIKYTATALEFGLLASRGSDFHAPGESRVELGTLPDLPGTLTPLWSVWEPAPACA